MIISSHEYAKLAKCTPLAASAALISFFCIWLADAAQSQTNADIEALKRRVDSLTSRIVTLEAFHEAIICGRMDSDLLKDDIYTYPPRCSNSDRPSAPVRGPALKAVLVRPGVFRFEFDPPRAQIPIVLATPSKAWGNVPVEAPNLRVTDVRQSGFTIETFNSAELLNPTNVSFFFVVLGEAPAR